MLKNKPVIVIAKTYNKKKTFNDKLFEFFQEKLLPLDFASKLLKI